MEQTRWLVVTRRLAGAYSILAVLPVVGTTVFVLLMMASGRMPLTSRYLSAVLLAPLPHVAMGAALIFWASPIAEWRARRSVDDPAAPPSWLAAIREVGITLVGFALLFQGVIDLTRTATSAVVATGDIAPMAIRSAVMSLVTGVVRLIVGLYFFCGAPRAQRLLAARLRSVHPDAEGKHP